MFNTYIWLLLCVAGKADRLPYNFPDNTRQYNMGHKFQTHPMLFFSQSDIISYRNKAIGTHKEFAKRLFKATRRTMKFKTKFLPPVTYEDFGSKWNEKYGNILPVLSMSYVLDPDNKQLLQFISLFMDRMSSYRSWYVIGSESDEIPVSHSLMGFAIAFDMVYNDLDSGRKKLYLNKLINVTKELFTSSTERWWGGSYIQNHVATNLVALLSSALVLEMHIPEASFWVQYSLNLLDRTLHLLNGISDGSISEGVTYGSYTSRSLLNFVYLTIRHFKYTGHLNNNWIKSHFDMYYYSMLPGLEYVVGIADSAKIWMYGPCSQLYFLDTYVLRNGSGNWLAEVIRTTSPHQESSYLSLHTDFIFYDAQLSSVPPLNFNSSRHHTFKDWGVVTYSSGPFQTKTNTFVSFKSGAVRGKYIHNLSQLYPDLLKKTNPGHEHPDQNSFTLTFLGEMFITDGYYGEKFTKLDNVHMFYPSDVSKCSGLWAGQLGDCEKWLRQKSMEENYSHGNLLLSVHKDGFFIVSGESSGAYHSSLKLESVFRALLLLEDEFAIVIDSITTKNTSNTSMVTTIFNNVVNSFQTFNFSLASQVLEGFQMVGNRQKHYALWLTKEGLSSPVNITKLPFTSMGKSVVSSNVNITQPLINNRVVSSFLFFTDSIQLSYAKLNEQNGIIKVSLSFCKGEKKKHYNIYIEPGFKDIYIHNIWKRKVDQAGVALFYVIFVPICVLTMCCLRLYCKRISPFLRILTCRRY